MLNTKILKATDTKTESPATYSHDKFRPKSTVTQKLYKSITLKRLFTVHNYDHATS